MEPQISGLQGFICHDETVEGHCTRTQRFCSLLHSAFPALLLQCSIKPLQGAPRALLSVSEVRPLAKRQQIDGLFFLKGTGNWAASQVSRQACSGTVLFMGWLFLPTFACTSTLRHDVFVHQRTKTCLALACSPFGPLQCSAPKPAVVRQNRQDLMSFLIRIFSMEHDEKARQIR